MNSVVIPRCCSDVTLPHTDTSKAELLDLMQCGL